MSIDFKCVTHNDKSAAGDCSRCQMPYCSDCLDMEMGQPLCKSCKKNFSSAASESKKVEEEPLGTHVATPPAPVPAPKAAVSPLNFKAKGLEDDPFGLFNAPAKNEPLKVSAAPAPNLNMPKPVPVSPSPVASAPGLPPLSSSPAPGPSKGSMDLDSLLAKPQSAPTLKAPTGAPTLTPGTPMPFPMDSKAGVPGIPQKKKNKIISLTKIWTKYLIRRSYEMFDPLAQKLHVPTYVFLAIMATLIGAAVIGIGAILSRPSVDIADTIPAIHIIRVNSGQISEMDVTTYGDFQNQLQTMGFTPLIQMTVPQLPSPNFFDVGIKDNIGTYSEVLKLPGQITPHLSFVTVFTNGIWFSSNGWEGENKEMEYLLSKFYPKETPDQLYVKHVQAVEKLKQDNGWQVQSMNENRYMAALSDHLRWYLAKKDIQGYKADFNLWH